MFDPIAQIIAYPELSLEEMAELRRAIADDPVVAALFACRKEIAASIRSEMPGDGSPADDRSPFALFSLYRAGRAGDLTADEITLVTAHAERLEDMFARHPGLAVAAEDVASAASEFSGMWDAHFEGNDAATEIETERASLERRPVAPKSRRGAPAARRAGSKPSLGRTGAPPRRRTAYRWAVRTAIAISVVAFAFVLSQVVQRDADMVTVETADGETRVIDIGEGSRIRLLESSTLSYADPQSSLIRRARLSGRAFFDVAAEERGFIVETPTARITVLGTTFSVEAPEGLTEVVLTDGRLTLSRRDKLDDLVVLAPGQMSRVVAGAGPTPPVAVDVSRRLTWTGLFIFQSTPLDEIAKLLGDHFVVTIKVEAELSDERVTGTFDQDRSLREILSIIASAVGATVQMDAAGGYVLTH